jgi:hypothetical protein
VPPLTLTPLLPVLRCWLLLLLLLLLLWLLLLLQQLLCGNRSVMSFMSPLLLLLAFVLAVLPDRLRCTLKL